MICVICHARDAEPGRDECFRCRVLSVGFTFHGSAQHARTGWHRTAREWREENFGTNDERELARRGIERV